MVHYVLVLFNCLIGIWIAAGMIIGFMMPPAKGLVTSSVMYFHVPTAIAMEVAFMISAYHGWRWLKTRDRKHDALSYSFAEFGAWLGIIATITGALWARLNWGEYWSWDPQQVGIVATLLTYAALFSLRAAVDDEEKQRDLWAVYAIIGVVSAIFWTFIFRSLPMMESLHPRSTLIKSEPLYRFALYFNVTGYILLVVKISQVRAQLELAAQRVREWDYS